MITQLWVSNLYLWVLVRIPSNYLRMSWLLPCHVVLAMICTCTKSMIFRLRPLGPLFYYSSKNISDRLIITSFGLHLGCKKCCWRVWYYHFHKELSPVDHWELLFLFGIKSFYCHNNNKHCICILIPLFNEVC